MPLPGSDREKKMLAELGKKAAAKAQFLQEVVEPDVYIPDEETDDAAEVVEEVSTTKTTIRSKFGRKK